MIKTNLSNRPQVGSRITVEPIRKMKDVKAISTLLSDNPRNYLLFTRGINNGLRTGGLLKLKVAQVKNLKIGDTLTIRESKTKKDNIYLVGDAATQVKATTGGGIIQGLKAAQALTNSILNKTTKIEDFCRFRNLKGISKRNYEKE